MKTAAMFFPTDHLGPFIEQFLPASQGLRMDHLVLASNEADPGADFITRRGVLSRVSRAEQTGA